MTIRIRRAKVHVSARPADSIEEIRPGVYLFTPAWKVADDARSASRK